MTTFCIAFYESSLSKAKYNLGDFDFRFLIFFLAVTVGRISAHTFLWILRYWSFNSRSTWYIHEQYFNQWWNRRFSPLAK